MTLDLAKFISNSIKTQAKIQHLDISTKTVKTLPGSIESIITKEYGDNYLLDADYISFFWGAIGKDEVKKLFNVVDKALGKSANKLTDTDFKKIPINASSSTESNAGKEDAEDSDAPVEDSEPVEQNASAEDEALNEEDTSSQVQTSYFFLKITLK